MKDLKDFEYTPQQVQEALLTVNDETFSWLIIDAAVEVFLIKRISDTQYEWTTEGENWARSYKPAFGRKSQHVAEAEIASDEELIQMIANARLTGAGCGGHNKSQMNAGRVRDYKEIAELRGLNVPADEELFNDGIFNGGGSY